jgi:hypothetical protein
MPSPSAPQTYSFIYGLDLRPAHEVDAVTDAQLTLTDGSQSHITMHLIEGTREQIKAMLLQSIDAFFDLQEDLNPE